MKALIIGSGGREHAIAWKLRQSAHVTELYAAPGNAGIATIAKCLPVDINNPANIAELAKSLAIELTVIGPEAPLVAGVAESFEGLGLRMLGPSSLAARLEGSKIFAKQFMQRHSIPTARFSICDSPQSASDEFRRYDLPLVVKADGLAAGKGVRIINTRDEFDEAIRAIMLDRVFGDAGRRVVIENCLVGREASVMLFTDGRDYKILAPARDYKRVFDADEGPNTGGMGSYSVPGLIEPPTLRRIEDEIIAPTLIAMSAEGTPFSGILYVGLMLTPDGPQVIEYNARLGDPETQAIVMRLESDLVEVAEAILGLEIGSQPVVWSDESSVCVVAASGGYPGDFQKGKPISGLDDVQEGPDLVVFHAGTGSGADGGVITTGGRVLGITARGNDLAQARTRAYGAVSKIHFEGMHFRKDIAAA